MLDGKALLDREKTQVSITRLGQLVGRLGEMMGTHSLPKLVVVISHRDAGPISENNIARLRRELEKHGAEADVLSIASFADPDPAANAQARPGDGIQALIDATAPPVPLARPF